MKKKVVKFKKRIKKINKQKKLNRVVIAFLLFLYIDFSFNGLDYCLLEDVNNISNTFSTEELNKKYLISIEEENKIKTEISDLKQENNDLSNLIFGLSLFSIVFIVLILYTGSGTPPPPPYGPEMQDLANSLIKYPTNGLDVTKDPFYIKGEPFANEIMKKSPALNALPGKIQNEIISLHLEHLKNINSYCSKLFSTHFEKISTAITNFFKK